MTILKFFEDSIKDIGQPSVVEGNRKISFDLITLAIIFCFLKPTTFINNYVFLSRSQQKFKNMCDAIKYGK